MVEYTRARLDRFLRCAVVRYGISGHAGPDLRSGAVGSRPLGSRTNRPRGNARRRGVFVTFSSVTNRHTVKTKLRLGVIGAGAVVREIYQYLYFRSRYSSLLEIY